MKRPLLLYLVTFWLCLGMVFFVGSIGRLARHYQQVGQPIPPFVGILQIAALALAVWLVWGFIRVRPVERWLCVFFFGYWAASTTWGIARLFLRGHFTTPVSTRAVVVIILIWLAVFVPNVASIVYLFTARFREFALPYVEQSRREAMQRYAQKRIQKGLDS